MPEPLTLAQLKKRYDGEWVLLDELVTNKSGQLRGGHVLAHSKDRDEIHRRLRDLHPRNFAIRCFRQPAKGRVFLLNWVVVDGELRPLVASIVG